MKKMKKKSIQGRKETSKEKLLFNMEKVPSVSEKCHWWWKIYQKNPETCPSEEINHPRKSCCSIWKWCLLFHKSAIDNEKNIILFKTCRKRPSKAQKMPSKEGLLYNMEMVLSVSKCVFDNKKWRKYRKVQSKAVKFHPIKTCCSLCDRCHLFQNSAIDIKNKTRGLQLRLGISWSVSQSVS